MLLILVEPAGDSESFFFETRKNFVGQYYGVENDFGRYLSSVAFEIREFLVKPVIIKA